MKLLRTILPVLPLIACASTSPVKIDEHLKKAAAAPTAAKPLELQVTDGERTWTVKVPGGVDGYELVVPTKTDPVAPGKAAAAAPASPKLTPDVELAAYLRGIARVRELRAASNLELAVLETMKLVRQHPRRARLWAMLGTLQRDLGHKDEARKAWEKALELDPNDPVTAAALERLAKE
jgi:tetratricopeptide (TPR) repeat protein